MSDSSRFGKYLLNTVQEVVVPTLPGAWAQYTGATLLIVGIDGTSVICYQKTKPDSVDSNNGLVPRYDFMLDGDDGEIHNVTTPREQIHIPITSPIFDNARDAYNALIADLNYNHGTALTTEQVAENYATVQTLAAAVGVSINIVVTG